MDTRMWLPHLGNRTSGQKSGASPDGHEALALEDAQDDRTTGLSGTSERGIQHRADGTA